MSHYFDERLPFGCFDLLDTLARPRVRLHQFVTQRVPTVCKKRGAGTMCKRRGTRANVGWLRSEVSANIVGPMRVTGVTVGLFALCVGPLT